MEPLVEVYQHKGNSGCMNGLSGVIGAPDEQCEFERRRQGTISDYGDRTGQQGAADIGCVSRLDFVRGAPCWPAFGSRSGSVPTRTVSASSAAPTRTTGLPVSLTSGLGPATSGGTIYSPGALAGVWAEENSRSSLFEALRRKETFATSGTRISVRVFGGWDLPTGLCSDPNLTQIGTTRQREPIKSTNTRTYHNRNFGEIPSSTPYWSPPESQPRSPTIDKSRLSKGDHVMPAVVVN